MWFYKPFQLVYCNRCGREVGIWKGDYHYKICGKEYDICVACYINLKSGATENQFLEFVRQGKVDCNVNRS
jgi:hypothetical protein